MSLLTSQKQSAYSRLSASSSAWAEIDAWLSTHAPDVWEKAHTIDSWLATYREDDRVGLPQYERVCGQFRACYEQLPAGYALEDDENVPPSVYRLAKKPE